MLYSSTWKITLAGNLVLDFTDYYEAEPEIAPSWVVQVVQPIRAAANRRFPRGNVSHSISYTRVMAFDTHADAQIAKANLLATLPRGSGECSCQIAGGGTFTLLNACLAPGSGAARVDAHLLHVNYIINGGALLAVPNLDGDNAPILDGDGVPINQ